jgi:hypothetical protein
VVEGLVGRGHANRQYSLSGLLCRISGRQSEIDRLAKTINLSRSACLILFKR